MNPTFPHASQSPAVKGIEVISIGVLVVKDTGVPMGTTLDTNSPTFPALVLLFVVVPTTPPVVGLKVIVVAVAAPNVGVVRVIFVAANPEGKVVLNDGTPPELVTRTELFAVGNAAMTFAELAYSNVLMPLVAG